jgi:ribosome biogenesis GTPase A
MAEQQRKTTAFDRLQEQIKYVDLIIEVVDARAPGSSRHPSSEKIFGNKPRLIVLTKLDLADSVICKEWIKWLSENKNERGIALSLKTSQGKKSLINEALKVTSPRREAQSRKGILPRPMRICVVGMPNVGKSSLINWLIGHNRVRVANKPGITRAPQWIKVHPQIELLDTPGILPVNQLDADSSLKLALCNLLAETSYDAKEVARKGLELLNQYYPNLLQIYLGNLYSPEAGLEQLATKRNFITQGGKADIPRAAKAFLTDLGSGKLGAITLDRKA